MSNETVAPLLAALSLDEIRPAVFSHTPTMAPGHRIFGGLLLAQSLIAAGRTVPDGRPPYSLHADFLHAVDAGTPIVLAVESLRDTRAFSTRRTVVSQSERTVFTLTSSFQDAEAGLEHQTAMPAAPRPHQLPRWKHRLAARARYGTLAHVEWPALDLRCDDSDVRPDNAALQVWLRTTGTLDDDPLLHAAVLSYASDLTMLAAVPLPASHVSDERTYAIATLEHSMWFFRDLRVDDWLLHDQHSPVAQGGRGLAWGKVFTAGGQLVAASAQEGLLRTR